MFAEFSPKRIVSKFRQSGPAKSAAMKSNDFIQHHFIANSFCSNRLKKKGVKCTWSDYYAILDDIRVPFDGFFDPGANETIPISSIYNYELPKKIERARDAESCDTISEPSAEDFYMLVKASHPTVIKGGASNWPALSKWSLGRLTSDWWNKDVVASISPTGDFDGPEDASLWGLNTNETLIIVRPAHAQMKFPKFVEAAIESKQENVTHYLEYFPLKTLQKRGRKDIPTIKWSHFLAPRLTLLWFGMSGIRNPVGRLHYDRHENLMAMIAGSKQFVLFGPDQGDNLYAALPVRSGTLTYRRTRTNSSLSGDSLSETMGIFIRDKNKIDKTFNEYHTYSPVDINNPDFIKYPKYRRAKKKICDVEKGDIIYVPADWWHQVTSRMDHEGKSIGVNVFYEPFYKKPGYLTLMKFFLNNRYYSHLYDIKTARPCSANKICLKKERGGHKSGLQSLRRSRRKQTKEEL